MTDRPVWDEGGWKGFPALADTITTDICVVGLGGSGLAAIEESLKLGGSVVGIDRGYVAGGAAGRNAGFLMAGMPLFYHEARAKWGASRVKQVYRKTLEKLAVALTHTSSRQTGSLRIASDDEELGDIGDEIAALVADGFEVHSYDGPEGEGMLLPADGVYDPLRRCRELAVSLAHGGAVLYEDTPAVAVEQGRIETPRGSVEADVIVVAVDGRLEEVFPQFGGRVRTARLEMLATAPLPSRFSRPVYTAFGDIYWQQLTDGPLVLGGLRNEHMESSWSTTPGPTEEVQKALDGYLGELGIDAPVTHRWAGHAAYTENQTPIFEEVFPSVWAVGAYSGHGNVLGAVYARAAVRSALSGVEEKLL